MVKVLTPKQAAEKLKAEHGVSVAVQIAWNHAYNGHQQTAKRYWFEVYKCLTGRDPRTE